MANFENLNGWQVCLRPTSCWGSTFLQVHTPFKFSKMIAQQLLPLKKRQKHLAIKKNMQWKHCWALLTILCLYTSSWGKEMPAINAEAQLIWGEQNRAKHGMHVHVAYEADGRGSQEMQLQIFKLLVCWASNNLACSSQIIACRRLLQFCRLGLSEYSRF